MYSQRKPGTLTVETSKENLHVDVQPEAWMTSRPAEFVFLL